ncbi:methyltransferase domain-containing protein [Methanosphaerula subterraneus]|uniref:methyltransferase domain-containing protein n=1 Tax=Methanosphaerula subterraneus TaxID=3350244 RepID=UPI003F877FA7
MKVICLLSGEHPILPAKELEVAGTVTDLWPQVALMDCPDPAKTARLAQTHLVLRYLATCEPTLDAVKSMLADLDLSPDGTFAVRAKKVCGTPIEAEPPTIERFAGGLIGGKVSLTAPDHEYHLVFSGDRCFCGELLLRIDRRAMDLRNPYGRPFFHPGVMMPRMARTLVNLSLAEPGEILYDPFCGTGGTMLEADLIGIRAYGSDTDRAMLIGSRQNLPGAEVLAGDATCLPVRSAAVDAVVSDLPYGQSVPIIAPSLEKLYSGSLEEIRRVLKPGRRAVIVTHQPIGTIAQEYLTVLGQYEQRVHKSLTRRILVLEK